MLLHKIAENEIKLLKANKVDLNRQEVLIIYLLKVTVTKS